MLDALKIPKSSQMLVFSQTSLQRRAINPRNPRAIYFNDDVYVGYIPHAPMMEISAVDPKLGGVFYSLDQVPRGKAEVRAQPGLHPVPRLGPDARRAGAFRALAPDRRRRRDQGGTDTGEIDALHAARGALGRLVRHRPARRADASGKSRGRVRLRAARGRAGLSRKSRRSHAASSTRANISRRSSDIVALMVLEHQAHMHNYITRLNYETQIMTATYGHIRYLKNQENAFLRYLLFTEEMPLTAPVSGDAQYVADFTAHRAARREGPLVARPRFANADVQAPMLVSHLFGGVRSNPRGDARAFAPAVARHSHWAGCGPAVCKTRASDRQAILEILRETKPNLPAYWRPLAAKR